MRFGNYNLTTETVEKRSTLIDFRMKRVKTTANQLVGRFHHKIGTFRRLKQSRSESPLSYKESLFERNIEPKPGRKEIFTKDDFPNRLLTERNDYVFGNIKKLGLNQSISGKNKNIYTSIQSEFNLKHLINSKISDENVEYKILKDYFDTTSYSDIVKDSDFKNYLNKKNYNDVLDYMQTENSSECYYDKIDFEHFDTNKRVYKTWGYGESNKKSVKKIKNSNNNLCNSLKRIKRMFSPDDEVFIIPENESSYHTKSYCELLNSCECLLNNYFVDKKMYKLKNSEINYSEQVYLKIIKHFLKSKGFSSIENYIDSKYTRIFNSVLKSCDEPTKNYDSSDLAKNFIYEDVFKNYDYITPSCRKTCSTDIPSNRAFKKEQIYEEPISLDDDHDNNKEFYFNYNYNWDNNSQKHASNKSGNVILILSFYQLIFRFLNIFFLNFFNCRDIVIKCYQKKWHHLYLQVYKGRRMFYSEIFMNFSLFTVIFF